MDLETENRIAAILMKEAAELRRQAEKDGVSVYLHQPKPRVRPNSRFLTATVRGVQQANRAVEMNEMWRVRQKELELDDRLKGKSKDQRSNGGSYRNSDSLKSTSKKQIVVGDRANASCSSSKSCHSRNDDGLKDEELEEFLHSRAKRGRGAVGSRMDETGPYLSRSSDSKEEQLISSDTIERCVVYGPEKPSSLKPLESSEEETNDDGKRKKQKKIHSRSSKKNHSEKHKSGKKSKDKREKRKELKRSKHNH
ncbi:G patch domain protein [Parasponia andersonii]|uniref:G patch domain protein n=1 Tax=Parasponia andersonii TaxID=3476 RepID=A0A2P5C299_PARAD|nr:G patch domain protein [Parasponia andersonii]